MGHPSTQVRTCYLVRHAIAEDRGERWPDDTQRPLTTRGAAKFRRAVRGLARLDVEIDRILTSPLVRAAETAAILRHDLRVKGDVREMPELAPGGGPARTAKALLAHADVRRIALVGHEPDLGLLAAWLIGAREPIPFRKGGVCRIDVAVWPPDGRGRLIWLATPRMLRSLGHK